MVLQIREIRLKGEPSGEDGDSFAYSQGEKFYFICTFLEEKVLGEMYIPRGRGHFFSRKPCFVCFTLCLFSCLLYGALNYV